MKRIVYEIIVTHEVCTKEQQIKIANAMVKILEGNSLCVSAPERPVTASRLNKTGSSPLNQLLSPVASLERSASQRL